MLIAAALKDGHSCFIASNALFDYFRAGYFGEAAGYAKVVDFVGSGY